MHAVRLLLSRALSSPTAPRAPTLQLPPSSPTALSPCFGVAPLVLHAVPLAFFILSCSLFFNHELSRASFSLLRSIQTRVRTVQMKSFLQWHRDRVWFLINSGSLIINLKEFLSKREVLLT